LRGSTVSTRKMSTIERDLEHGGEAVQTTQGRT
jgi:hypothetical protein